MSEHQNSTPTSPMNTADVLTKVEALLNFNNALMNVFKQMMSAQVKLTEDLSEIDEKISIFMPMMGRIDTRQSDIHGQVKNLVSIVEKTLEDLKEDLRKEFGEQQAKLRGLLLARMDGLREEMNQLRETV